LKNKPFLTQLTRPLDWAGKMRVTTPNMFRGGPHTKKTVFFFDEPTLFERPDGKKNSSQTFCWLPNPRSLFTVLPWGTLSLPPHMGWEQHPLNSELQIWSFFAKKNNFIRPLGFFSKIGPVGKQGQNLFYLLALIFSKVVHPFSFFQQGTVFRGMGGLSLFWWVVKMGKKRKCSSHTRSSKTLGEPPGLSFPLIPFALDTGLGKRFHMCPTRAD